MATDPSDLSPADLERVLVLLERMKTLALATDWSVAREEFVVLQDELRRLCPPDSDIFML
jgi:hypothetical protein